MSRILVVEDDEVLRNELIELLRNEGYEAEYISTFSDTAGQIIKSKPDLVLLDINIRYRILEMRFQYLLHRITGQGRDSVLRKE